MSLGFLLLASALGAAPVTKPPPAVAIPGLPSLVPKPRLHSAGDDTACAKCHVTESWSVVKFNHDRTGFPLKESHRTAPCKACHGLDLKVPQPQACAGCHRDEHQAQLGLRCEGCHDETSWQSHTFNVDAHQRTNFPLLGGHAALPCDECHAGARDRSFARPAVACVATPAGCEDPEPVTRAAPRALPTARPACAARVMTTGHWDTCTPPRSSAAIRGSCFRATLKGAAFARPAGGAVRW